MRPNNELRFQVALNELPYGKKDLFLNKKKTKKRTSVTADGWSLSSLSDEAFVDKVIVIAAFLSEQFLGYLYGSADLSWKKVFRNTSLVKSLGIGLLLQLQLKDVQLF